jgi:hypothetical protein
MAINIPILTEFSDSGIKAAKAAFGNFKTAVGDAQGGMGKFKAGSKVALDAVAANAASFAVAGGVALAKFAMDGVQAFQKLALGAEKFATSTGLAIEDASRYMEVAGDIGIPIDAVSTAIGRLNKTIGADPDKVRELGVDLVYLADGSLDVNATFLNTIERIKGIKDPAEKAKVAAQLLGKGWQSMSTLIEMGADDLNAALGKVSDTKVISAEELKKAKEFRDTMDDLNDAMEDLKLSLGQSLVPMLTDIAKIFGSINDVRGWISDLPGVSIFTTAISKISSPIALVSTALDGLGSAAGFVFDLFSDEKEVIPVFADDMVLAREDTDNFKAAIKQARLDAILPFNNAVDGMSTALMNADNAWKVLTDNLEQEVALDQAKIKLAELEAAAKLAFGSGRQADIDAYEQKALDFVTALAAISGGMSDISSKEILIRFKTQGPAAAIELAEWIARGAEYGGLSPADALGLAGISTLPPKALGGPVMGGTTYLVGEQGAELFTPSSAGNITPNHALGGGATITVNVNGGDPDAVVRAIQKYARQNGAIPLQTTTSARF